MRISIECNELLIMLVKYKSICCFQSQIDLYCYRQLSIRIFVFFVSKISKKGRQSSRNEIINIDEFESWWRSLNALTAVTLISHASCQQVKVENDIFCFHEILGMIAKIENIKNYLSEFVLFSPFTDSHVEKKLFLNIRSSHTRSHSHTHTTCVFSQIKLSEFSRRKIFWEFFMNSHCDIFSFSFSIFSYISFHFFNYFM